MATTNANNVLGNAWHIPDNAEPPGQANMRSPVEEIVPGVDIAIFNGNQFTGGTGAGNQLREGSVLIFKRVIDATWKPPIQTEFAATDGNNKYFKATIPNTFQAGDSVQYYLKIAYSDRATTFLHGSDGKSKRTAKESEAQADPFMF